VFFVSKKNKSKNRTIGIALIGIFASLYATAAFAQAGINLVITPALLGITRPSSLGCQAAHLYEDAKTPFAMIALDDDFIIPIGGVLGATWLPPQPTNPNDIILGVDSDGDCVRDDIERYITNLYPKKSDYLLRENLFRYAIWMNRFLNLPPVLPDLHAKIAVVNMRIAGQCVKNILGANVGGDTLTDLFANFHNTWPRSDKYVSNMVTYISGWTTRDDPVITCN
jgi:hypothetical protein